MLTNVIDTTSGGPDGNGYFVRNVEGEPLYIFDRRDDSVCLEAVVVSEERGKVILDRKIDLPKDSFLSLSPTCVESRWVTDEDL